MTTCNFQQLWPFLPLPCFLVFILTYKLSLHIPLPPRVVTSFIDCPICLLFIFLVLACFVLTSDRFLWQMTKRFSSTDQVLKKRTVYAEIGPYGPASIQSDDLKFYTMDWQAFLIWITDEVQLYSTYKSSTSLIGNIHNSLHDTVIVIDFTKEWIINK